jgi:hypothetical protein
MPQVIGFNKDVSRHSLNRKAEATQKEREQKGHQVELTWANDWCYSRSNMETHEARLFFLIATELVIIAYAYVLIKYQAKTLLWALLS